LNTCINTLITHH